MLVSKDKLDKMKPSLSVVIAVYNGADFLKRCLPALAATADAETEIILVNDGSTDNSAEVGEQFGAKVITLPEKSGAANARNNGVRQATGETILFIDADVVVPTDTIRDLRRLFEDNTDYTAIFGSYDDAPGEPDFFSQYRNLMHCFFHQTSGGEADTFWSGFGAVKREAFLNVGGFDAEKFEIPSVEDIELGYRLREQGYRILLVPELEAKHLKKWNFASILRTDFWQRAVPWAELILLNPQVAHNLNMKTSQKISALLAGIFLLSLPLIVLSWWFVLAAIICLFALIAINRDFYTFFLKRKGFFFTLGVLPMHLLYFLYSSAAFAYSWFNVKILHRTIIVR
jgi:GT2 family glycosyltransferase